MNLKLSRRTALASAVIACLLAPLAAAKTLHVSELPEISAFNDVAAVSKQAGRYAADDGRVLSLHQPAFRAAIGAPAVMAREFVDARRAALGIADSPADLEVAHHRDDGAFHVVRFRQVLGGVPVYGSDLAVTVKPDGEVIFVSSELRPKLQALESTEAARPAEALRAQVAEAFGIPQAADEIAPELMVFADQGDTRLAWVYVLRDRSVRGAWEVIADAATGELLQARDTELRVDATATVFDPDPLSSARANYGSGGHTDAGDADSAALTAQLKTVTLPDVTFAGGVHRLEGPWARCEDWDPPSGGVNDCPTPVAADFSAARASQLFEGPNVYYALDKMMRYLNVTLGVTVVPNTVPGGVRFDPHGWNGADNSSFTPSTDRLTFGEGGVDDAEDADVIIHELGHGLHDWVTNGGLSQVQGLSEGVGDYFANSYNRTYGNWTPADPQWFWTFQWDGHNEYWGGRVTNWNVGRTWPGNLGSGIHAQGQYWASCNMIAWVAIGRDAMDTAMLRGLAMTTSSSNQQVAAQAVINAAVAMNYTANQIQAIGNAYNTSCTYGVIVPNVNRIFRDSFGDAVN